MRKLTRRETREFLLQMLYARSVSGPTFDATLFATSYYTLPVVQAFEDPYFMDVYAGIQREEGVLLAIFEHFAPKFEVDIMPLINLLPICIGTYEMLYLTSEEMPEKVAINEAIELAKRFSDDGSRELVNGVLGKVRDEKSTIRDAITPRIPIFFI
jgi:transcription antitermination protein NusB